MIRDHHKNLIKWRTKHSEFARILQVANDLVSIVESDGVLWVGDSFELSPKPEQNLVKACNQMIERTFEKRLYIREDVEYLLGVCGLLDLYKY